MIQTLFNHSRGEVSDCACPRCGSGLHNSDIDVTTDSVACRQCGVSQRCSELIDTGDYQGLDRSNPPQEASFRDSPNGFVVSVKGKCVNGWFTFAMMLFVFTRSVQLWNPQLNHLGLRWGARPAGIVPVFLFIAPFAVMLLCGIAIVIYVWGQVILAHDGDLASVFIGVGPVGRTRRFRWQDVESVMESRTQSLERLIHPMDIELKFKPGIHSSLHFGGFLIQERWRFMFWILRSQLRKR